MASEPIALTGADFLNRVRSILNASLQRWEFAGDYSQVGDSHAVCVRFLGLDRVHLISHHPEPGWLVHGNPWLTDGDEIKCKTFWLWFWGWWRLSFGCG